MKNVLAAIAILFTPLTLTYSQALDLSVLSGVRERILDFSVEDAPTDYAQILNGTNVRGQFIPMFVGHHESDSRNSMFLIASTSEANDICNNVPLMIFDSRISPEPYHLNLGNGQALSDRLLFGWRSGGLSKMVLSATGNLGVGSLAPKARVQVSGGDVYIEDIDKGIIMKSPDGNCWRVTVDNIGNMVSTAVVCP